MKKYIENMSILSIFLLFSLCSLVLMILGADQYIAINHKMQQHFDTRTPIAYVSNKIRQNDSYGAIQVMKKDGKDILVLSEVVGEKIYETWIYEYEGELRELYIEQGDTPELDWGMALLEIKSVGFKMDGGALNMDVLTKEDQAQKAIFTIRSGGMR